jgi:hypothetical protein
MKLITTLFLLAVLTSTHAQKISRSLQDHNNQEADLVIFAYGSDNPVKIGTVDVQGNLLTDLSTVQMPELTAEIRELFTSQLWLVFAFGCGNGDVFGLQGTVPAVRGGNVALMADNEWTGSFFIVSDQELKPWMADPGYNSAVRGQFWDIIYVDADVSINITCQNEIHLETGIAEASYTYDLDLRRGFNWVEYSIEDIHVTDPEVMASFPSKVKISNMTDQGKMKWMADYFF